MVRDIRVHLLPALFEPEELRGGVAVVIDVLRASTVIVHALAHGARAVVPCFTVEEARATASGLQRDAERSTTSTENAGGFAILLGGERDGVLIPGFDLDNSPFAYTEEVVKDKTIVFTTTNGTAALHRAALADRVLIGAFVNLQAVVHVLFSSEQPVHLVCAGTRGKITLEDALCAGAIVERLQALYVQSDERELQWPDDQMQLVHGCYWDRVQRSELAPQNALRDALRNSYGGRNCIRLGFDDQIDRAATFDLFDIVPEYDHTTGEICVAKT